MTTDTNLRLPWRAAGTSLIAAAILGWIGVFTRSHHGHAGLEKQLAEVADASAREMLAAGLWLVASMLFILSGVFIAIIAHARRGQGAFIGALLLAVGGAWITAAPGAAAVVLHMLATGNLDSSTVADLTDAFEGSNAWLVTLPLMAAFVAAPVILALGLRTMRVGVGGGVALIWIVSVVAALVLYGDRTGEVIACGGMMVAHMLIGLALRREGAPA
ncbi:MAG: hypothetical protein JWL76_1767 [Thermoleophilia bacterium]|nr:hypothetical protein [Thermoleophilia bacterium]